MSNQTSHVDEQLAALALGTLPDADRAGVLVHVAHCARCASEFDATLELMNALAFAVAPVAPPPAIKRTLLDAVGGGGRLYRFADRVAALLDVTIEKAKAALDHLDAPDAWAPLGIPGVNGISFIIPDAGPSLAGCNVAFLRIPPGVQFPAHTHLASEQVLILQGGYIDEASGHEYGPGNLHLEPSGSTHSYRGTAGPDCYCLGVVMGRIQIGDIVI